MSQMKKLNVRQNNLPFVILLTKSENKDLPTQMPLQTAMLFSTEQNTPLRNKPINVGDTLSGEEKI